MKRIDQIVGVATLAAIAFFAICYGSAEAAEQVRSCLVPGEWRIRLLAIAMVAAGGVGLGAALSMESAIRKQARRS